MNKKLAELKVNKTADHYDKVVKALENAGFVLVLDNMETTSDKFYIVAESEEKK